MSPNRKEMVVNVRNVKLVYLGLDLGFLLIHATMLLFFWHQAVWPMFIFNIFSLLLYSFLPLLLHREKFSAFVQLTHLEVVMHMTLAIFFVGWDSGFQIAIMGFNIFLVYAEYQATSLHLKRVHSLALCIVSSLMYVGVCIVDHHHTPPYLLPAEVAYRLRVGWAVGVFAITIFFLQLFAYLASGMQRQLSEVALYDRLTGLHNRFYMNDYLEQMVGKPGHWLAIADIDDFKLVNDSRGHNCGDYVLKTIADLARQLDPRVEACRWGGEEFLLVGSSEGAVDLLERLRGRVESHDFLYEGQPLHLTITIGVSDNQPGDSVEAWVNRADMKLYAGKNSGKNQVVA